MKEGHFKRPLTVTVNGVPYMIAEYYVNPQVVMQQKERHYCAVCKTLLAEFAVMSVGETGREKVDMFVCERCSP